MRLRIRMLPTVPGVALAPTTATDFGWKIGSSECGSRAMVRTRGRTEASLPHEGLEALAQAQRDRAGFAVADGAAVDLHDRDDLRRGAGQEALVGRVDVVPRQRDFLRRDVGGAG